MRSEGEAGALREILRNIDFAREFVGGHTLALEIISNAVAPTFG